MSSKSYLHKLIKSLSGSEKRSVTQSFKEPLGVHAKLYRAIAAQDVYDEALIRDQFKGEAFLKQLSAPKAHLYRQILKTLKFSHHNKTLTMELRDGLDRVELLWNHNLHHQSLPLLKRLREKATHMESWLVCLECLQKEITLVKQSEESSIEEELETLFTLEQTALDGMIGERTLRQLYNQNFTLRRKGRVLRNEADKQKLDHILDHPVLQADPPTSFRQAIIYHYIHIHATDFEGKAEATLHHYRQLIRVWQADPVRIKHDQERYFGALTKFIDILIEQQNDQYSPEINVLFEVVSNLKLSLLSLVKLRKYTLLHLRIRQFLNTEDFQGGMAYVAQESNWEAILDKSPHDTQLTVRNNLLTLYFLGGAYSKAREFAYDLVDEKNPGLRQDVQYFARILLLPIHYELGHSDLLADQIRSARRFFKRRDDLGDFERVFFRHFGTLERAAHHREATKALEDLYQDLDEFDGQLLGIEELLTWLKGKGMGPANGK